MSSNRWIMVSNRLPVTASRGRLVRSSGGLVTAIESIRSSAEQVWLGGAPDGVTRADWNELASQRSGMHPVFIESKLYDDYYNGFCNDLLWPLFHYETDKTRFSGPSWESYRKVNQIFADEILRIAQPGDLIWIHDFHFFFCCLNC